VNVRSISAATTVNTGSDADTVNVGSTAPTMGGNVNSIGAVLTVNGDGEADTLNVDDTGDSLGNTGTLTSTELTGLGMTGTGKFVYGSLESLKISLGSGGDTFTVKSTHGGSTELNTNGGGDTVTLDYVPGRGTAVSIKGVTKVTIPGVEFMLATVGASTGDVNRGSLYVRLTDIDERTASLRRLWAGLLAGDPAAAWRGNFTQREKMTEVRAALAGLPGVRSAIRNLTSLRQGPPVDIDLSLTGPSVEVLLPFAERLGRRMERIPGVVDVDITLRTDKPQMLARLDRERMADLGITVQEVADTLRIAVGGDDRVSRYRDRTDGEVYDVELRLVGLDRGDVRDIGWRCNGPRALGLHQGQDLRQVGPVAQAQACALPGQTQRGGAAKSAGSAGDQGDALVQSLHAWLRTGASWCSRRASRSRISA
jgi:hypothetical protein